MGVLKWQQVNDYMHFVSKCVSCVAVFCGPMLRNGAFLEAEKVGLSRFVRLWIVWM